MTSTVRHPLGHCEGHEGRQVWTCFQGAHHLARGIMSVYRLLECQLKSRHWQSDMDFQKKERILMAWEREIWRA